ncbi:DHA2 family efflux MFS transporter permease subunit [Lactobacillus sp. ESL0677]|uniref:DHA2 family efflux MFS transporter permease subunit n=1 Tax=Lactobacillus sp. ESL0677 TaxID=2983208 RepID=UPI0023F86BBE|nr:DHA2 family efflux MFS transporter permease subunit [Lactobacillus sp. ESL0677]WEV36522.1 DHA2 family efflux MFS transporter permease subunit [Lactobacillus sp. ESL0677]
MSTKQNKLTTKQANCLFVVLLLCCILSSLMQTSMTTILPVIMKSLKVNASQGQWLTSAFTLTMGIMIPVTPFLLKRFSTRKIVITSLILFSMGLLVCTVANTLTIMILGRVFQAISCGIFVSLTQVVIVQIFPAQSVGTYMGIYGLAVGGVPVFSPTLSGYLTDKLGYRAIFGFVLVVTLIVLLISLRSVSNVSTGEKLRLDNVSLLLSVIGFGGLTLGIDQLGSYDYRKFAVLLLLIACIALIVFCNRQVKAKNPFLSLQPLKNADFTLALLASMILYAVMMAGSLILPLFLQNIQGFSSTATGLITLPGSIVMMIFSPIAGKLFDKYGIKPILIMGSLALFISCVGLANLSALTPTWYISIVYAFRMLAISMLMMPLVTWGMLKIDSGLTAHGSALISAMRTYAGAISMVAFTGIMTSVGHGKVTLAGINKSFIILSFLAGLQVLLAVVYLMMQRKNS